MAKQPVIKKFYRLELETVDEWDVKTFAVEDLIADLVISDAGYLVISEEALNALKQAKAVIPEAEPVKVVKTAENV